MIQPMFLGLNLYYADPAQPLTTAGEELDDFDDDLSDLSVRNTLAIVGAKSEVGLENRRAVSYVRGWFFPLLQCIWFAGFRVLCLSYAERWRGVVLADLFSGFGMQCLCRSLGTKRLCLIFLGCYVVLV